MTTFFRFCFYAVATVWWTVIAGVVLVWALIWAVLVFLLFLTLLGVATG